MRDTFKIARYVIGDDAIIDVRINTNDNGINNNQCVWFLQLIYVMVQ
jgi:hypothetical protein